MCQRLRNQFQQYALEGFENEEWLESTAYGLLINGDSRYYFGTVNSLDTFRGFDLDAVLVDCAFMLSKNKENKIYETLAPSMAKNSEKFFVFVE
jgi:hypothetical protein